MFRAAASAFPTQSLTLAIPLGFFLLVLLWGFFQRRSSH